MTDTTLDTTLFRFAFVRPVASNAGKIGRLKFLNSHGIDSEFLSALNSATTFLRRQAIAADFIHTHSDRYVAGFSSNEPWVAALRRVLTLLESANADDITGAKQATESIVASSIFAKSEHRASVRRRLWESLAAAYLAPRTDPRDRGDLIAMLRALYAIEHLDTLNLESDIARVLGAEPLIPRTWFVKSTGQSPTPDTTSPTTDSFPIDPNTIDLSPEDIKTLQTANALRDRYFDLERAIADIELTDSRARFNKGKQSFNRTGSAAATASQRQDPVIGRDTGKMPPTAIANLQPKTVALIADSARDLFMDPTSAVLQTLAAAQKSTVERLNRIAGPGALVDLDAAINTTLDPTDIGLIPMPAAQPFDESYSGSIGSVKPLGIGDLLVVKETLLRYELGEVSYVENVMRTENRERVYRKLDRVQTLVVNETSTTNTDERDLEATERYEMQNAVSKTLASDTSVSAGVDTSASYGPVKIAASADFSTSSSSSESQSSSTDYARDVTDRSLSKVTQSVRDKTASRTLSETEETNTHGFDNTAGPEHVVGIYRWLNKRYQSQVMNYGKRLMMQFIAPDPAAFYLLANKSLSTAAVVLTSPEPLPNGFSFRDIKPNTYQIWTDLYQVANVNPPPPMYKTVGKAIDQVETSHGIDLNKDYILTTKTDSLNVPEGYTAIEAWIINHSTVPLDNGVSYTHRVAVGRHSFEIDQGDTYEAMENEDGILPIAIKAYNVYAYALTVEVRCQRTDATLEAWQLSTYNAVVTAYNNLKAAYDSQVSAAGVQESVTGSLRSPEANRQIERDELKKGCLVLLTDQHFADAGAVTFNGTDSGFPEIRVNEAMNEGDYLQFLEQCFEWDQITYSYYPYFWARKSDWLNRSMLDDSDPLFASFLKAGAARILVPVRRNYEKALIYFLETAQIWNGGASPTIDDPLYVSIIDEIQDTQDADLENATPYGDPWEYVVPTTLVSLQEDATLPVFVTEEA